MANYISAKLQSVSFIVTILQGGIDLLSSERAIISL